MAAVRAGTSFGGEARRGRPARWAAFVLARLGLLLALAPLVRAQDPRDESDDEREVRSFAIPETSEARVLMDQARTHIAAGR
jgi:hypothetical protein